MIDFTLTDEQQALQQKARDFAIKEVLPVSFYYDEHDDIPLDVLKKAYEAGLVNMSVPKEYGGPGYGILEGVIMIEEIAAACPGLATSIFDNSLGTAPLLLSTNDAAKKKYLPKLVDEFKLICFGTSEPTTGSDVSGIRCEVKQDGEDYILNGTKFWITNGGIADYMTVFATTDPESKHGGIGAFLVEMDWEGVSQGRPIPKLGQRCSNTTGVHFDNVRVPKENVLAKPGDGFVLAMQTFSLTRPAIASFAVGAARSAMEFALDYAKKRKTFGSKIKNYQGIQFKLADMYQKVETSRLLTWKSAWDADNGRDANTSASVAKLYASEAAMEVVNEALQTFGGYGYTRFFPIEKFFRDTRLFMIYEGTSEIQRVVIAGFMLTNYEPVMPSLSDVPVQRSADPLASTGKKSWRCGMCGYVHDGDEPPDACPYCFYPSGVFKDVTPAQ
ncbi:MAG: acyl-CoA dehydrogenase family protein [Thermodesulfobacteriota bacterium]|nr:acyl-CoA dehydrogenase family protein [Thermodesulfobacteriota bacterium]